ncbi:MAG: hypothetical protein AB8B95_11555 [Pseudohongiellaceae bacterium]
MDLLQLVGRQFSYRHLLAWFIAALSCLSSAAEDSATQFIRFLDDEGQWHGRLQTAIVSYHNEAGVTVNLVAAVHLADTDYYDQLNKYFSTQGAVLYELVAEKDQRPTPAQVNSPASLGSPVSLMQRTMATFLGVGFQLEHIDYSQANFRHADVSPAELQAIMQAKNENAFSMFLSLALAQSVSNAAGKPPSGMSTFALIQAMMVGQQDQAIKYMLAKELGNSESTSMVAELEDQLTILGDRNRAALDVLSNSLQEPKLTQISLFYGAAHMQGLERALLSDFGFWKGSERWLDAWKIPKSGAPESI